MVTPVVSRARVVVVTNPRCRASINREAAWTWWRIGVSEIEHSIRDPGGILPLFAVPGYVALIGQHSNRIGIAGRFRAKKIDFKTGEIFAGSLSHRFF